ncbi:unnamed protein product [Linum tenue]|uniref:Uncharacterized protein n=1 Tax=Linum tenue TaxID=586396 RepID=A0AAV0J461_9ROSI|nr:unnamed protein product [Linum tenue]
MLPQLIDNLCYVAFVGVICLRSLVAGLCRIQICDGRSFSWEESLLPLSLEEEEAQRRRMRVGNTAPQKKKKSLSELTKSPSSFFQGHLPARSTRTLPLPIPDRGMCDLHWLQF